MLHWVVLSVYEGIKPSAVIALLAWASVSPMALGTVAWQLPLETSRVMGVPEADQ